MIRRKRNVEMGFWDGGTFHPIRDSVDYDDARAGEGHKLPTSGRLRRVSKALKKRIGMKTNPATAAKSDLYVMQLGARSFGVFLKTYMLKTFATKAAAQSYMRSIRSRAKGNPIKIKLYKFYKGQKLAARFIGDRDAILHGEVISRTPKTVTVKIGADVRRHSIKVHDGTELIYPLGKYSMAPIFRAERGDRIGNPKSKKNPAEMHPLVLLATGLSGINTALQIREKIGIRTMKRKTTRRRKTNGTTTAKRKNPVSKRTSATKKNPTPRNSPYHKLKGLPVRANAADLAKARSLGRKGDFEAYRKFVNSKLFVGHALAKLWETYQDGARVTNPTAATLARCRKLLAEDRRKSEKQISEIPITHYRRVANPKRRSATGKKTVARRRKVNASASAKTPSKPVRKNPPARSASGKTAVASAANPRRGAGVRIQRRPDREKNKRGLKRALRKHRIAKTHESDVAKQRARGRRNPATFRVAEHLKCFRAGRRQRPCRCRFRISTLASGSTCSAI
jgi:hypothetical protein